MRFSVFTHVIHEEQKGRLHAYSPYIREMNLWFKNVGEVEIIAPLSPKKEELIIEKAYEHNNIIFTSISAFNLLSISAILKSVVRIPVNFFRILSAMKRADHLHIRCPGNIGLLAVVAQIFFPRKPKTVKYAGNWDPGAKLPWTYKLQKWILSNTLLSRNIKVLVYGDWEGKSKNIVSFFTASFTELEKGIIEKDLTPPYKFIYTGNLVEGKGIFEAITLIDALNKKGVMSELEIYGGGILKNQLENFIQKESLQNLMKLKGRRSLEELKEAYKKAHFVILLSKSEGWPKTLAEGMWYGCVPIATSVSCVPWMLGEGSRGVLIPDLEKREENKKKRSVLVNDESLKNPQFEGLDGSRDVSRPDSFYETDVEKILRLLENPEKLKEMSSAAQEWSQQYTLEKLEAEIKKLLVLKKP
ncbi:glycosyl transferase [Salegentibacter salinarum]|uniref:Glycosyl transferase n=1 Tax=Salegentibacter salinarum TaxID=447422 RepID=A0A2N0U2D1_9FLAO|nr:glycosyltransferase family 4 protein [Salegentibacter salinarum]PKD21154.1 glycosyl transferase [Salegentibacter salinarum]SKB76522.1 Glycosyltransferase involved in cell wall bisynthesis [Salegentibacter salinarum]